MAGDRRVRAGEQAERVNAAADLLEAGVPAAEAARVLAGRFGVSVRQARRDADRAGAAGRGGGPEASGGFTVKLPAALARRGGGPARGGGAPVSAGGPPAFDRGFGAGPRNRPP